MNVKSVEKQEKSVVELIIEVGHEEFEAAIDKVYKKQRGKIAVPGFRKGHAPRKVIEGMYGASVFYEEAINEVYPEAYAQAIEQEKLDAVAWPDVEIQEVNKDGFTFKALVTVRPEVKLGEYKALTAPKAEASVSEEDIDHELKPFIDRATRLVSVDRAAQTGDTVVLDFEGFDNGVPFEGGKADGHSLELGSGSFVPGFEDQLVGMKAGDEGDINITFPEDYHADLAGKPVVFHVKISEVKEKQAPEVDDEFAKDVSEFETLAEFRSDLENKLKDRKEVQARKEFENALLEQVVKNMEVEIPDAMVDARADQMMEDYARRITSQGIPFENYLQMMGMTMEDMRSQAREGALRQVQVDLALGAVAEAEHIEITDEEKEAEYVRLSEQYSMKLEQVKSAVAESDLVSDLRTKKAANVIYDSAKVGEAKADTEQAVQSGAEAEEKPKKRTATRKKAVTEGEAPEEKPKKRVSSKKKAETEE